jgi:hydrogenase/urease accessory protein HupE
MHWLLPGVAAAAAAAFAVAVLRQYAARRRPYQLAWGIALSMFAAASLALTAGVSAGWSPLSFKLYYLFGAVLNVAWLALGTVELLAGPVTRRAYLAGLGTFTALSVVLIAMARVTPADLAGKLLPEGKEFLPVAVRALAVLGNVVGTVVVAGGAVASGLAMRSRRELRPRFEGTLLIALGVLLAASGGVFAFLASSDKLALSLALGACVMYLGFRRASAPLRPPVASGP